MKAENDSIKKRFKEGLYDYEVTPPPGVWDAINKSQRQPKLLLWRWTAAAASLLLLFGLSALFFMKQPAIHEKQAHETERQKPERSIEKPVERIWVQTLPGLSSVYNLRQLKTDKIRGFGTLISTDFFGLYAATLPQWYPEAEETDYADTDDKIEEDLTLASEQSKQRSEEAIALLQRQLEELNQLDKELEESETHDRKWSLALGYGMSPSVAMPEEEPTVELTRASFSHDAFTSDLAYETSYYEQIHSTEHSFPISFGLLAGMNVSKRWQFETGLIYTRLSTLNRTLEMGGRYKTYQSTINYLGLPVGMRYDIVHKRSWQLYASQAVIIEKGIRYAYTTNFYDQDELIDSETTHTSVWGIQLSSLSSMGVNIPLSDYFSLYAQGGLQLFFLNEKQPFSIRSTRTFWPTAQTGLRFRFQ